MPSAGRVLRTWLSMGLFMVLLAPRVLQGQAPGAIPPDVQAILEKLRSGKPPSAQDQKRLQEWGTSQAAGQKPGAQPAPTKTPLGVLQSPREGAQATLDKFCPPAAGTQIPSAPPSNAEYLVLLKTLADRHGARLDPATRTSIDTSLGQPGFQGASMGAVLNAAGAIDESIRAAALAALQNPADALAANNLGVSLSEAGDHASSARVLLHAIWLRPNSPLAAVNLGWTYFNAGATQQAQREFQRAQSLASDMAAPEAGLGLIALCRGDKVTGMRLLKSSLSKGYSPVAAAAFMQAQRSQTPSDSKGDQTTSSEDQATPPNPSPDLIPDLPLRPQGERNADQVDGLNRIRDWAKARNNRLLQRYQELSMRVAALNQRAVASNGNALFLPVVFDRELFEFRQVLDLSFTARFRNMGATTAQVTQVMNTNGQVTGAIWLTEGEELGKLQQQLIDLLKEMAACGDNEYCRAQVVKKINAVKAQMEEKSYQICMHSKQSIDVTYAQTYKHWKTQWDDLRPAAADLYAFTEPILQRVWVPSLNELLQVEREMEVMTLYHASAGEAAGLAAMAKGYKDLKCIPPPPPEPPETPKEPKLPQAKPPDCPFEKPFSLGCGLISFTLGCDHASIEGGEGFRLKASRDFKKHETTLWGGAGASAGAKADFLGPMSPKAELTAEAGVGVKFGRGGVVSDVFVSSQLTAGGSIAGQSLDMSASGTMALEGGASLSGSLPGGIGGTVHN